MFIRKNDKKNLKKSEKILNFFSTYFTVCVSRHIENCIENYVYWWLEVLQQARKPVEALLCEGEVLLGRHLPGSIVYGLVYVRGSRASGPCYCVAPLPVRPTVLFRPGRPAEENCLPQRSGCRLPADNGEQDSDPALASVDSSLQPR